MWRPDAALDKRRLAAECEAFLAGTLAEHLIRHGRDVPVWAWTNALAHGSRSTLTDVVVSGGEHVVSAYGRWPLARAYVAAAVLDATEVTTLVRLQRRVLVPLELDWAASSDVQRWRPSDWVAAMESVLERSAPALR